MNIYLDQNILVITIGAKLDYQFCSNYPFVEDYKSQSFDVIDLDFSETKFITLPGAMYLVNLIYLTVSEKKKKGIYVETGITGYSKVQLELLINFGFISILKLYGNLHVTPDIDKLSNVRLSFWANAIRSPDKVLNSVYWPISTIPPKFENDVDQEIHKFYNNFIDCFSTIINSGLIKNLNPDIIRYIEKYFIKAVNEATKNVWDHSESWGLASIHSNSGNKTVFCLFDFGVGFITSYIKRKGIYNRTVEADKRILEWLFGENNSSNSQNENGSDSNRNFGHGLTIMQKFIDFTEGTLLINTDKYSISYDKSNELKIRVKDYYPGTQIMMNF